jgi:hypothetical protein
MLEKLEGEILESCGLPATFLQDMGKKTTAASLGFCQCGCGGKTRTRKGKFNLFLKGHFTKGKSGKCGEDNPNWKGGRKTTDQGYILIRDRGHARADVKGDVREAIMLGEKALGKPLPPKAVMHHANGTKDHGPLVICQDHAYHMLLHQRMRAIKACGHANWLKCPYCKEYDDPKNLHINNKAHYHTKCQTDYQRERYGKRVFSTRFSGS